MPSFKNLGPFVGALAVCCACAFSFVLSAEADTYTYTYTGLPSTVSFDSGCLGCIVDQGSITFAAPLPSNLPWATPLLTVDTVISYSFTSAGFTFTPSNSAFNDQFGAAFDGSTPYIATGAGGNITGWSIVLSSGNLELRNEAGPGFGIDDILINCCSAGVNILEGSDGPGSWSGPIVNPSPPPTPVPEPSSALLLLAAVTGLLGKKLFR
jgi:hypothetical protein